MRILHGIIWVRSRNCGCLVTWFCYQLIAKPGNKTATVSWPDSYTKFEKKKIYICILNTWIRIHSQMYSIFINTHLCEPCPSTQRAKSRHAGCCPGALFSWFGLTRNWMSYTCIAPIRNGIQQKLLVIFWGWHRLLCCYNIKKERIIITASSVKSAVLDIMHFLNLHPTI